MAELKGKIGVATATKGMTTCKICGRDFALIKEEHYIAEHTDKEGVIPAFAGREAPKLYDAFDCPHCGCQNIVGIREAILDPSDTCDCSCGEITEEEEFNSCNDCVHAEVDGHEEPCASCSHTHPDFYIPKEEENHER